jgi:signal transduction histidine kinase
MPDDAPSNSDSSPSPDDWLGTQLAGDLHDGLLQYVIAARMMNEVVQKKLRAASVDVPPELELVERYLQQAIAEGRRLIDILHGGQPAGIDLAAALEHLTRELSGEGRIACVFRLEGAVPRDRAVADVLYRVAQESLSNVRRHSDASSATLTLVTRPASVRLEVTDNGRGFATDTPPCGVSEPGTGMGLAGMRRRVEARGGRWHLESAPMQGTRLTVELPLP